MAYFAAVISVENTIQRLLISSHISIPPPSREILEFAYKVVRTVQEVLQNNEELIIKNCDNERVKSLNQQIREATYKLEDALESRASDQYEIANEVFLDFEKVREEINYFVETMKKIEKMMMEELNKPLSEEEEEEEEDDAIPLKIDGGKNLKMVGLSKEFEELKDHLLKPWTLKHWACGRGFLSIVGMAGIGKTALAMKLFEDPSISSHFDPRIFITLGPKYQSEKVKVRLSLLDQINHDNDEIHMEKYEDVANYIFRSLQGRRYLVVFDDVWNKVDLLDFVPLFPDYRNPSYVLVTTRLEDVAESTSAWTIRNDIGVTGYICRVRFLNKEESWDLLREKVFGEGNLCPFQLEKFGKKIAEHCEGLPLTIVTVANILSNMEKTLEYWKKVAEKETSVFTQAYDQMRDVLISSYSYLPQYLKPCFLYMGVFPLSCEISASKLYNLWHAEQFLRPDVGCFEDFAKESLRELFARSIVLVNQWSSRGIFSKTWVKTCRLHSVYWHLCVKEARKEVFSHVIDRYSSSFIECIESQRRLCIHNNVLFGIKEVHDSMKSISMVRSLMCTGPHHQYPVPLCFFLRLLRVLDALTIRFYKFPIEVLKLVQLRYLALTYGGKVPGTISKLWNLEYFIVHRHLNINKSSGDSSYLPMEIWDMTTLRHIEVTGGNLPDPCDVVLLNLLTLSGISVNSCSKEILAKTPHLKKLGIQIELTPDTVEPLCCFDHFSHLNYLESLKCVVVNPKPSSQVFASFTTFPSCLRKLSLRGLGHPWEDMKTIAKLPTLQVLKLRCYAFQGPLWETFDAEFLALEYLLVEDTDLVHWRGISSHGFPCLRRLIIRHCYKLKDIPSSLGSYFLRKYLELVDCPSFGPSVRQLRQEYGFTEANVHSSLNDEKVKS